MRRFLLAVPILLGVTIILFVLLYVLPGDPARLLTGYHTPSSQGLENLQDRLNTRAPLYRQYLDFLAGAARGDLGTSYRSQRPVLSIIGETLPNSLALASLALVLELILAIAAGAAAALRRGSFFDRASIAAGSVLIATPVFALGLALQLVLGIRLKWLPVAGIGDGSLRYYLMPALVMALIAAAYLTRVVRSSLIDVLDKEYIVAARANGLSERRILFVHALKNAAAPVVAVAALHFGFLIGSAVATEVIFNWPGIGRGLFAAAIERDRPVVVGITLVLATVFIMVNLMADILNAWLNPRVRAE